MSKFKVGDRVRFIGQRSSTHHIAEKVGTVVCLCDDILFVGVDFDNKVPMCHDLDGLCEYNHGWWCLENELELIKDEPRFNVIITSDGDVTTAKLLHGKNLKKEVTVKRYHKDEYSEKEAVKAVCKKLFGEDKPEKEPEPAGINCMAVCIRDNEVLCLTRGKIYEFSDGKCVDDAGDFYPVYVGYKITNFDDELFAKNFVKLVESDE
ncbi:MAG: hypothetical protein ACI3XQ_07845 [Eubacteriales bacterium]